jgi:hypothetical protein
VLIVALTYPRSVYVGASALQHRRREHTGCRAAAFLLHAWNLAACNASLLLNRAMDGKVDAWPDSTVDRWLLSSLLAASFFLSFTRTLVVVESRGSFGHGVSEMWSVGSGFGRPQFRRSEASGPLQGSGGEAQDIQGGARKKSSVSTEGPLWSNNSTQIKVKKFGVVGQGSEDRL